MALKRGRPVSGDQGSTDPSTAAKRAMWRDQKRSRRRAQREQDLQNQALQEAIRQPESDAQRDVIERISTQPFSTAGAPALLQSVEGEQQPAVFEGIRIQGIGGIDESGFAEPGDLLPVMAEAPGRFKPREQSRSTHRGRGKAGRASSVASHASSLTSWLNQGKSASSPSRSLPVRDHRNTPSPPLNRDFSFDSDNYGGLSFNDDDNQFPDHHNANQPPGLDLTQISYEDQLAAAIEASQQDVRLQGRPQMDADISLQDLVENNSISAPRQVYYAPKLNPEISIRL
jgi:hypothetical protein